MDIISLCITVDFLSSLDAWQHVLNILLSALLQENFSDVTSKLQPQILSAASGSIAWEYHV